MIGGVVVVVGIRMGDMGLGRRREEEVVCLEGETGGMMDTVVAGVEEAGDVVDMAVVVIDTVAVVGIEMGMEGDKTYEKASRQAEF